MSSAGVPSGDSSSLTSRLSISKSSPSFSSTLSFISTSGVLSGLSFLPSFSLTLISTSSSIAVSSIIGWTSVLSTGIPSVSFTGVSIPVLSIGSSIAIESVSLTGFSIPVLSIGSSIAIESVSFTGVSIPVLSIGSSIAIESASSIPLNNSLIFASLSSTLLSFISFAKGSTSPAKSSWPYSDFNFSRISGVINKATALKSPSFCPSLCPLAYPLTKLVISSSPHPLIDSAL